ncbi:MAG: S1C family serine protease [Acutalibacteraceae bacterium]
MSDNPNEMNYNFDNFSENENESTAQNQNGNEYAVQEQQNDVYSSYEWNAEQGTTAQNNNTAQTSYQDGYYRYTGSQINSAPTDYTSESYQSQQTNPYSSQYAQSSPYQTYSSQPVNAQQQSQKAKKEKKEKKPIGRGAVAAVLAICILASGALGFGGGLVANKLSNTSNGGGGMTINKVVPSVDKTSTAETAELSTSKIAEMTADSVVEITTEVVQTGRFSPQYITSGAGSGVIISENGYIITNNHVIENASKITVTLRDSKSYTAKLMGTDSQLDVALLKIDASTLTAATFGNSDNLKVGDKTVAIGNPLGQLGGTVTDGIVSSLSRSVVIDNVTMDLLQTNAAINPGNSGGGLFNGQGELIGLVVAKSSGETIEGLGFAIPVNHITEVLDDLMQYGYVRGRINLGMSLLDIKSSQMAMMYGVSNTGCYISSVETDSNAAKAGFSSGDRIISINGKEVSTVEDVNKIVSELKVGDTATFKLERRNRTGELSLVLEEDIPDLASKNNNSSGNAFDNNSTEEDSKSNTFNSIFDYFGWN